MTVSISRARVGFDKKGGRMYGAAAKAATPFPVTLCQSGPQIRKYGIVSSLSTSYKIPQSIDDSGKKVGRDDAAPFIKEVS
jgi:hypothetical protein